MNESELFGKTVRVNFARPPKATERSSRPVWADEEWLKKYGSGPGQNEPGTAGGDGVAEREAIESTENGGDAPTGPSKPTLPRVYLGVKIGIRLVKLGFFD